MLLWTAGILLALGLAWFVGAVVVPVWQVHAAIKKANMGSVTFAYSMDSPQDRIEDAIACWAEDEVARASLGGAETAAWKLNVYLAAPGWAAAYKQAAVRMATCCGKPGLPALIRALAEGDPDVRRQAVAGIYRVREYGCPDAIPALERIAASDPEAQVRAAAIEVLGKIRGGEAEK
jgi:hypothetical protein